VAAAFDAVGPSASGAGSAASTTLSWLQTCGASATYLLAGVFQAFTSNLAMTATYNGVAMTSLGTMPGDNATTDGILQVWAMANPPTGSALTVAVTATGGTPTSLSGGSVSLSGAASLGTPVTAFGFSTTASAATSTLGSSSLVVAFCGVDNGGTFTATAPSTSRFIRNPGGVPMCAAETSPGTGSSVTTAWTTTNAPWAVIAVEVQAAAAAGGKAPAPLVVPQAAVMQAANW
jgi:hypothetical protein